MVKSMCGRRIVDDIVQRQELSILQSLPEKSAAWSPGGVQGALQTIAVQITRIQEMEKELEEVKGKNDSLGCRLNDYKVSLKNSYTKKEEEQLKSQL